MLRARGSGIDNFTLEYSVINVGETPATITKHEFTMIADPVEPNIKPIEYNELGDCFRLIGGEAKSVVLSHSFEFLSGHGAEFDTAFHRMTGAIVRLRGRIEYVYDVGVKRRTAFLRSYNPTMRGFEISDYINMEYED